MSKYWKATLGVILIFIFGFLSGIAGSSIYVHHKLTTFLQHPTVTLCAALEKHMTRHLDLDAKQKQQIHDYFMENLEQRKQLQKQIQPQVQMLNLQTFQKIRTVLRPDQAERFRQNIEVFRKRLGKFASNPYEEDSIAPTSAPSTNSGVATPPGQ